MISVDNSAGHKSQLGLQFVPEQGHCAACRQHAGIDEQSGDRSGSLSLTGVVRIFWPWWKTSKSMVSRTHPEDAGASSACISKTKFATNFRLAEKGLRNHFRRGVPRISKGLALARILVSLNLVLFRECLKDSWPLGACSVCPDTSRRMACYLLDGMT